ncbi:MAG: hypothetical protein IT384_06360 [Deltaproteobacteria bacterium]|nr:hypothetical protein [Deltaproteobacteria bacterium]
MLTRHAFPVLLLLSASAAGFTQCGGSEPPTPLPPAPNPQPSACAELDEAGCVAAADRCEAVYVSTVEPCACPACEGPGCPPCTCAGDPTDPVFVGCQDRDPCSLLDETSCIANPECEPEYGSSCGSGDRAEPDPGFCPAPDCGMPPPPPCDEAPGFVGCHQRPPECAPVLCEIYCEYGHQIDPNGCPICACNPPPPTGCEGLDEQQCSSTPGCQPIYGGSGDCACPVCDPATGEECPPCDCGGPGMRPIEYLGCATLDPCAGLSEEQCIGTPGCGPIYGNPTTCACPDCDPNSGVACTPCTCDGGSGGARPALPPEEYAGCVTVWQPCERLDEAQCLVTPGCHAEYSTPQCLMAPPCEGESCDRPCGPASFAGCYPDQPPPPGCASDADCPGGYCEYYATCDAIGCPPAPPSQCVYPSCDDGSVVLCDALPPECGIGQVVAVRNGCYECVDARTCTSQPPPVWCTSDLDCPEGYCVFDGGGATEPPGGSGVPFMAGQCVVPVCDDGTDLQCRMMRPLCGGGLVAAIRNGCYECVDAYTCQ